MIPSFYEIILPFLQYLSDGKEHTLKECTEAVSDYFNLTQEERNRRYSGGHITIQNRTGWVKTHLSRAGLIDNKKRNSYIITKQGIDLLATNPKKIDGKILMQYPAYVEYINTSRKKRISKNDSKSDEISENTQNDPTPPQKKTLSYSKDDFLSEVYIDEGDYDRLHNLLLCKKNVILQGAPGVGKTFSAMRLAYSMMGEKDDSRVEMVQFHQNYTYEDFIMGYKPTDNGGFVIKEGVFYKFCKKAAADAERDYFFIIDEINRGNLSKIFGELLMLIEKGYRNKHIKLAYNDDLFHVPDNIYIIGMMNTADRSLAMIDYALRRRFSFFEMRPGFDSKGFKNYQKSLGNEKFDKVIEAVTHLNETIVKDDSLGAGFCIGHSYFCEQTICDEKWLQNVVEFDIIPMLREYWFDNDKKFKEEADKLIKLAQ
ncbi:MAG: AAA family ATPase [Prevotella sp.]|nr:AAA family ATPase [Prevotella sp.]